MDDLRGPLLRFGISAIETLKIQNPNGNHLFSPITASAGLMLIYTGSEGPTKLEIEKVLHLSDFSNGTSKTEKDIHMAYRRATGSFLKHLPQQNEPDRGEFTVFRFNRLFIQEGIYLNSGFVVRVKQLGGEITEIDFENDPETVVREKLNSHVNDGMNGKVPDCFDNIHETIGKDTKLVLASGVCFRARWKDAFDPRKTVLRPFYGANRESPVNVPTMKATMRLPYVEDHQHDIHYLEIPYLSNVASLLIFLPKAKTGLEALETAMSTNPRVFNRLALVKRLKEVDLTLPKFTLQTIMNYKTVLTSKRFGVKTLFSDEADLSRMAFDGGILLSAGVHAGCYSIDENGTNVDSKTDPDADETKAEDDKYALRNRRRIRASSLTPARLQEIEAANKPISIPFIVDHPFLFAVRHNKSGIMVCLGRVEHIPASETMNNEMSKEPEAQRSSSSGYIPVIFRDIYC